MYKILYDNDFLFDPFDDSRVVYNASITNNVNAASYLDFTIASVHPMYDKIEERSGIITVYWDNEELFQGQITKIELDLDGNKTVACSSALDWLREVQLRPYSTDEAECKEYEFPLDKAPESLDGYFQWVIDQYNATNLDDRRFDIDVNQANGLTSKNHVYFASTSPQTAAEAIESNILDAYGGYLVLRYDDNRLVLDLYSDVHEMNPQIIDFAENILDISKTEDTNDQYTAVLPLGKSPQYTAKQQKYHDEKEIYDKKMKDRDAAQKAKIDRLRKEEEAERKRIDGITDKKAKKAAQDALKRRQDARQKEEEAFRAETERLQNEQKVKDDANNADKTKTNPINISSLPDGGLPTDLDLYKKGDVVYSMAAVERYGYKEYVYTDSEVEDKQELLKLAGVMLRKLMAPALSIDVKAIDRALYQPEHTHLFVGQAVRVRSKVHGIDEFMMVSSISLNLTDPSQTTATLGVAYDTLTGQQSSYLKSLNSQIDASVDVVTKVEDNIKNTEITLGQVQQVVTDVNDKTDLVINNVGDYKWQTDVAWDSANEAQDTADEANEKADVNNERIENLKTEVDTAKAETEEALGQMSNEMAEAAQKAEEAKQTAETIRTEAQTGIQEAKASIEQVRSEANAAVESVRGDLAETETKAQGAADKAAQAMAGLTDANAKIEGLETSVDRHTENITNINGEIVGVKDTVSGVAETANSALSVATTNTQAINEQSTRIDTAYSDIEATRTSVSEVKQTADGLKVNLETNYLDKNEIGNAYASKAELNATSESITSTVERTYATKAALEGLQNIADAAIETWSGQTVPTASNPPASTWTTDVLKRQHSGDIYYDMSTGKSYRWGSADGTAYSWSMIADSDITKAIADAAKAQQTADGAKQDVVNLSNDVKATYTSKSEFKQTSDEIKASVSEVASANETNAQKIAEVSVKADGISAKVAEQAETINGHTTTIGQLSVKADGLQTKFEQVSDNLTELTDNLEGLINPSFSTNSMYGWTIRPTDKVRMSTYDKQPGGPYLVVDAGNAIFLTTIINDGVLTFAPKHRYRVTVMMKVTSTSYFSNDEGVTIRLAKPNYANMSDWVDGFYADVRKSEIGTEWQSYSKDIVVGQYGATGHLRLAFQPAANTNASFAIKSVKIEDITEAQTALVKTSELQQNLDGFKQTVSETYTTKDKFNNLSVGSTNLLLGTKTPAVITGRANAVNYCPTIYYLVKDWREFIPEKFTLSFDVSYSGTIAGKFALQTQDTPWGFADENGNPVFNSKELSTYFSDDKRDIHLVGTFRKTGAGVGDNRLNIRMDNVPGTFTFSNMKLERGNKATDWSPAPQDMLDKASAETTYTTKTEFTQTANEIRGTVAEQATTINGHTSTISTLSQKADKFETDISQVTEQATAIAGRTTKLEQDLGGFKQSVSNTYISKTDAEQNLIDAINGIQIGGSNMLLDTQKFGQANPNNVADTYGRLININAATGTGSTNLENTKYANGFVWRSIPSSNTANNADGPRYQVTVKPGGVYTFSFEAFTTAGFWVYFYGPNGYIKVKKTICSTGTPMNNTNGDGAVQFNATGAKLTHHEITWELDSTGSTNVKYVLFRRVGSTGYTAFLAPKLEEGNKATEWSPSPFDTLYASTITSTYAPKTMVQQTEDRITQTVEATYASKTQLTDEMKKSVKTIEIRGRMDGNYWWKLGRLTMEQQGKDFHIDYTGGRGFNGETGQNSQLEIHVRSSNGGGKLFAVTVNRLLNADMYQTKAFVIDATHIDLYLKSGAQYSTGTMAYYGQYSDFSGAKEISDISTAEGTELTVLEQSLSSKSYVDQKAESVSIGVVEAYKNGEHGDKLTTSSQLQAMKDSITSTVASTYETKSDATLKGKAIDGLINPDFATGTMYGWSGQNYVGRISTWDTSVGGPYLVCERFTPNSKFYITNDGVITVKPGNTYRVSANLRASHDFIKTNLGVMLRKADGTAISFHQIAVRADFDAAGNVWTYRYVDIKIPDKITAIKIGFGSDVTSAAGHFIVKGLRIEDVTLALEAQKTADKGVTQSSEAIQSLKKFQQSVEETYVKGEDLSGGSTNILIDTKAFGNANPNGATNGLPRDLGFPTNTSYQGLTIREIPASNTSANRVICEYTIKDCQGGQWYTASFFAKGSGTFRAFFYTNANVVESKTVANDSYSGVTTTGGADGRAEIKVDGRWRRYNVSWRLDPKNTSVFEKRFLLRRDATSGNIAVCGVKLEKGTIPSDWSPSPFDLAQQTSLNGELTKYTEKTTFEQTKNSFEWNIKSLAKYGPDKIPNGDPRSDLETIMAIEKDSNPPVYTFTVNNTSAPQHNIVVSRNRFALTSALIANRTYRFSFEARVVSGSVPSADYIRLVCSNDNWSGYYPCLDGSGLGTTWKTFTKVVKVTQNCTKGAIEYNATSTGAKKFYIRNVSIMDVTEGANAQSGVNELDTLIRYTSNGIEVGRKTNGQYTGPKALVNSNGSFDILQGEETVSSFAKGGVKLMRDSTTNKYQFNIIPFKYETGGSVNMAYQGVNLQSMGIFSLNGVPATPAVDLISINGSGVTNVTSTTELIWNTKALFDSQTVKHFDGKALHKLYYGNINKGAVPCAPDEVDHCICVTNTSDGAGLPNTSAASYFMILHPAWYMIQMQANLIKPSNVTYIDVRLQILPVGATTWVTAPGTYDFRAVEQGDPQGWHTRPTSTFFCKLDVGTRLRWRILPNTNTTTVGNLAKFTIARLPFSGLDTSAYNY